MFIKYDIVDFYPSISETLLNKCLDYAKLITPLKESEIEIIRHARKSLLFHQNSTWVKKNDDSLFDVTQGCYDGAEICELVGLYILNTLSSHFDKNDVGLYRDDGLAIVRSKTRRTSYCAR